MSTRKRVGAALIFKKNRKKTADLKNKFCGVEENHYLCSSKQTPTFCERWGNIVVLQWFGAMFCKK
ncbi:MAG: hypothetical protein J6T88_06590 [Bacteroidales bacterium]|nr:hypothetical protein [Bacteroidales bacterium]